MSDKIRCWILGHHWLYHPHFDNDFHHHTPYYCWMCGARGYRLTRFKRRAVKWEAR